MLETAVKTVKELGIRDWLIVVLVVFLLGSMYGQQRQVAAMIGAHAYDSKLAYEDIKVIKNETVKSNLLQFAECITNSRGMEASRRRCELAMEGIRAWR